MVVLKHMEFQIIWLVDVSAFDKNYVNSVFRKSIHVYLIIFSMQCGFSRIKLFVKLTTDQIYLQGTFSFSFSTTNKMN